MKRSFPETAPRFLNEAVIVRRGDEWLVDGGSQLVVLRGGSANRILPRLIPLMDGHRTLGELAAALPDIPPEHVRATVALLRERGLIEDGSPVTSAGGNAGTLAFFRRMASASGVNRTGEEALHKLRAADLAIVTPEVEGRYGEKLRALLAATGAGGARSVARSELGDRLRGGGRLLAISLSLAGEDCAWHCELDRWCFEHRISWLRVVLDESGGYADLGPWFRPEENACYACFRKVHGRERSAGAPIGSNETMTEFWLSMAAVEITYLLTGIGQPFSHAGLRRYSLDGWESKDLPCPRIAGCARCRPGGSGGDFAETAVVFEDSVGLANRASISPKRKKEQTRIGLALSRQAKRASVCRQYALEEPVLGHPDQRARAFTRGQLATILTLTAGIRDGQDRDRVQRWAATAGNLGSVELFVAVRQVEGLPAGLYFYQPGEHSMARIDWRSGGLEAEDLIRRVCAGKLHDMPDALALFTGASHRLSGKYGAFGYKLTYLDAGAGLSQMETVARAAEIHSRILSYSPDDLVEEQLGLEPKDEQATAVMALSRAKIAPVRAPTFVTESPRSLKPARAFYELTEPEIVEMLYRESRIEEGAPCRKGLPFIDRSPYPDDRNAPFVPLPPSARPVRALSNVLKERTSVRRFAEDPVTLNQLGAMLSRAGTGDARDWPEHQTGGQALQFIVLAWRVVGLDPGVYVYDSSSHGLGRREAALSPADVAELFIQDEFTPAPLAVWVAGNLAAVSASYGAWGHRQLLLRAGAATHRLWFAAMETGLDGSIVAGLVPGAARTRLGVDGYRCVALVAFAGGVRAGVIA